MRSVRVNLEDGTSYVTSINGTDESIRAYFVGTYLNMGDREGHGPDKMVKVLSVDFLE